MSETLVLMLGALPRWLRITDDAIVARGEGSPQATGDEARVVAVVPAADVTIHYADLPDLSAPQAAAAARLMVADKSAAAAETLHVAVGPANAAGERPVVAIDNARMLGHLSEASMLGFDPDAVIAAPMLLRRPDAGFVRGDLGGEMVVRGRDAAFADDPVLTAMLTGGDVTLVEREMLEADIVAAVASPEVDLRQGPFARRRRWGIDWAMLRLIGWLALALAIATLLLLIVQWVRLDRAADRIEAQSVETARAVLPRNTTINSPLLQLNERLAALRGPGGGVMPLSAAVVSAASAAPGVELTTLIFDGGGTLRVTARAASPAELAAFDTALANAGMVATPGPILVDQGRQVRDYTVAPR